METFDSWRYNVVEIYPREGTETVTLFSSTELRAVEIYPREGTETPVLPSNF